jgi:hypothetical protein
LTLKTASNFSLREEEEEDVESGGGDDAGRSGAIALARVEDDEREG